MNANPKVLRNLWHTLLIYAITGVAYWATSKLYLRYVGKEIVFSPLVFALLTVPFWPRTVFVDKDQQLTKQTES